MKDSIDQFESRKQDHLRLALEDKNQSKNLSQFDQIELLHEALPDLNFSEINISTQYWGLRSSSPLFISSMTAGHSDGVLINQRLAKIANELGWAMGVGSQRRELFDSAASEEWKNIRKNNLNLILFGNIGISQLITSSVRDIQMLVDNLEASALFIHLNPLQEVLQKEGTPDFKGGIKKISEVCKNLSVPVIVKEVGCGILPQTSLKLIEAGVKAIDVAGAGGTHWGRLEGERYSEPSTQKNAAIAFKNWGVSTIESLLQNIKKIPDFEFWASGGVRSGLDAAKLMALGAQKVGIAMPALRAALDSEESLRDCLKQFDFELKVALFCTGCLSPDDLRKGGLWKIRSL